MPKTLFTKSQIYDISKNIIIDYGIEKLSIKSISSNLKCTSQPIYSNFKSIDEIKLQFLEEFKNEFRAFIKLNKENISTALIEFCYNNTFSFRSFFFDSSKINIFLPEIEKEILIYIKLKNKRFNKDEIYMIIMSLCSSICLNKKKTELNYLLNLFAKIIE